MTEKDEEKRLIKFLRAEAKRALEIRAEKNADGSWKLSNRRRGTLKSRARLLKRAAFYMQCTLAEADEGKP